MVVVNAFRLQVRGDTRDGAVSIRETWMGDPLERIVMRQCSEFEGRSYCPVEPWLTDL
jgi:hypothetical protein